MLSSIYLLAALIGGILLVIMIRPHISSHSPETDRQGLQLQSTYVRPTNLKIVGLVFYGRKSRAEILQCYLKVSLTRRCRRSGTC